MENPTLLEKRLHHYKHSYQGERLRSILVEDGFDPGEVELALRAMFASTSADIYGAAVPAPSSTPRLVAVAVTSVTACGIAFGNGVLPWLLLMVGGPLAIWLPFAAHSVAISGELYALVKTRYDLPNVSRGIGIGMVLGAVVFLATMVSVIQMLGSDD